MSDYPYDLGAYSRSVTTNSAEAQKWFDRGLNWCFGYNHEEAGKCFENVLKSDPECAIAKWGLAYIIGPNYNKPWMLFDDKDLTLTIKEGIRNAKEGLALADKVSAVEIALLTAIRARYPSDKCIENFDPEKARENFDVWNDNYANAMRTAYEAYPDDPDVTLLFVEAMMNRTPWQMWDLKTGTPAPNADTDECVEVLERAMAQVEAAGPDRHPGLLHLYIHLMEMSPYPERALKAGKELRGMVPDAGHLQHMPTHIEVQCGDYQSVVDGNFAGIVGDRKYAEHDGKVNFYTMYRVHNLHFYMYGSMLLGRYEPALMAAQELIETVPDELLRMESPPMPDWIEAYLAFKPHVWIRFGKWQELIDEPLPKDKDLMRMTIAMLQYGKAIAHAVRDEIKEAEYWQAELKISARDMPESRNLHTVPCYRICEVALAMLDGELEYRKGNFNVAYDRLRHAVELEDGLPYDEPWGWMQPARHALGALLLEQGHIREAYEVYREDLGFSDKIIRSAKHFDNVWALRGFYECLVRLGRNQEAELVKPRLDMANALADNTRQVSCMCRLQTFDFQKAS